MLLRVDLPHGRVAFTICCHGRLLPNQETALIVGTALCSQTSASANRRS